MQLYVIRHGQTVWNLEGRLQGSKNTELNDNGRAKARELGEKLSNVKFDFIFSSPLNRAYETAQLICGDRDIQIIKDERLREISFGVDDGTNYQKWAQKEPYSFFFNDPARYIPPEGGETLEEVCARTKNFVIEKIEPLFDKCERVMVVAHGALNSALMCYLENRGTDCFWGKGLQKNCEATIFDFDGTHWKRISE